MKMQAMLLVTAMLPLAACQPNSPHAGHEAATPSAPPTQASEAPAAASKTIVQVSHAWSRATPPGAAVGGGYLTLQNEADAPDRLLAVESNASARVEIHEMRIEGDVMKMRKLDDGVVLPAHVTVVLEPGGNHLMFIEPRAPFVAGQPLEATLVFQNAPRVTVQFDVRPMGADAPAGDHPMH